MEVVATLTTQEGELREPLMLVAKIEVVASLRNGTENQHLEADPKDKVSANRKKEITTRINLSSETKTETTANQIAKESENDWLQSEGVKTKTITKEIKMPNKTGRSIKTKIR